MSYNEPNITIQTHSPEETTQLGTCIGNHLKPGHILALIGNLGSGKTCMSRGIAKGMNISTQYHIHSPAFDLIHEHPGSIPMYHMDFYRLDEFSREDELWVSEYIHLKKGVCVIEWADKFILDILDAYLKIQFTASDNFETHRSITFTAIGTQYQSVIESMTATLNERMNVKL